MDLNTTNQIETAGPVAAAERIKTIDIVRGGFARHIADEY